jgi:hypothetical protein|uniref:Uncharacterized protein n=1 Tax=viral metagenome TaxID=1070528 RepID=A0A6C0JSZ3_9ZZZZ
MNFRDNSHDEIFNLNKNNFNNNPSSLRAGDDMIFNKKKISHDIVSSSSASSNSSVSSLSDSSSNSSRSSGPKIKKKKYQSSDDGSSSAGGSTASGSSEDSSSVANSDISTPVKRKKDSVMVDNLREKKEIIYQLERLEARGYKIPFKFNLNSDLEEMRLEYNKLLKEKEIDSSVRFQRKMLMAFVTGSEYLNNRYDPFAVQLDGWSEQVHDNINDYDDIFEELHEKYKSTGKKMAPELRLFISLSGSAFMFHLTNRMFKEQPLPNVENVLKSNPELMKEFQKAAAKEYVMPSQGINNQQKNQGNNANGPGIFGMVSGLFNNIGNGSMRNNISKNNDMDNDSISEIDSIIDDVHKNISVNNFNSNSNNIETLSVSDEEITSIIEDNADIKILNKNKNNNKRRSLNI